jgi:hypothetical protein
MTYTKTQLTRFWHKLFDRVTEGYGYQPYGYDWPTMRISHPGLWTAFLRLKEMYLTAK